MYVSYTMKLFPSTVLVALLLLRSTAEYTANIDSLYTPLTSNITSVLA
jgi:hypothetical protein